MPRIVTPKKFLCPLTGMIMEDPVYNQHGYTYDKKNLEAWFQSNDIDPTTQKKLPNKKLYPGTSLKNQILEFLDTFQVCSKESFLKLIQKNDVKIVEKLNYLDCYLETTSFSSQESALHLTAKEGHLNIVKWLVSKRGIQVDGLSNEEETALHCAVAANQIDVAKWLIKQGASLKTLNRSRETPLDIALKNNHEEIVKLLIGTQQKEGTSSGPFHPVELAYSELELNKIFPDKMDLSLYSKQHPQIGIKIAYSQNESFMRTYLNALKTSQIELQTLTQILESRKKGVTMGTGIAIFHTENIVKDYLDLLFLSKKSGALTLQSYYSLLNDLIQKGVGSEEILNLLEIEDHVSFPSAQTYLKLLSELKKAGLPTQAFLKTFMIANEEGWSLPNRLQLLIQFKESGGSSEKTFEYLLAVTEDVFNYIQLNKDNTSGEQMTEKFLQLLISLQDIEEVTKKIVSFLNILEGKQLKECLEWLRNEKKIRKIAIDFKKELLIQEAAHSLASTKAELENFLNNQTKVVFSISSSKELKKLMACLEHNPTVSHLELYVNHLNTEEVDLLTQILSKNRNLIHFRIQGSYMDYSDLFLDPILKNQAYQQVKSCLSPFLGYSKKLDALISQISLLEKDPQLISKDISDLIYELILGMPLETFDFSVKKACYQWIIFSLAEQSLGKQIHHPYFELLKVAFITLLDQKNSSGHYLHPGNQYDDLIFNSKYFLITEKQFKSIYRKLHKIYQEHLASLDLNTKLSVEDYQKGVDSLIALLAKEDIDLSSAEKYLGPERVALLKLKFCPLYQGEKEKVRHVVFSTMKESQFKFELKELANYLNCYANQFNHFQGIADHSTYCLNHQVSFVQLKLYKIAAILTYETYWISKCSRHEDYQLIYNICDLFKAEENAWDCLEALKKAAAERNLKKNDISFFRKIVLAIQPKKEPIEKLYEYILDFESKDMEELDLILEELKTLYPILSEQAITI